MGKGKAVELQTYRKEAFVDATEGQDKLIVQVVLDAEKTYTKEQVAELVQTWKAKVVK